MSSSDVVLILLLAGLLISLLVTVYILQQRKKPFSEIQKELADYLAVEDLIGFSLIIKCKKKVYSKVGVLIVRALLIIGFVIIFIACLTMAFLIMEEEGIKWVELEHRNVITVIFWLVTIAIYAMYHSFIIKCEDEISAFRRSKTCYMCLSKSKGLSFLSVTYLSKQLMQKTPQISGNTDCSIPLIEIGDIEFESEGKEDICKEPVYYFKEHNMGIYAPAYWKDQLKELIEKIDCLREPTMNSK